VALGGTARPSGGLIYMKFIYHRSAPHLENLRQQWHLSSLHGRAGACLRHRLSASGVSMLDVVMLALGLGFFVLSVGYAYACERL
jgi:hypothetical protein